jgi:hypothetical protein
MPSGPRLVKLLSAHSLYPYCEVEARGAHAVAAIANSMPLRRGIFVLCAELCASTKYQDQALSCVFEYHVSGLLANHVNCRDDEVAGDLRED